MRRRRLAGRRAALAAAVALAAVALLPAAASGAPSAEAAPGAGTATLTVGDVAEAWYVTAPADPCSAPIVCPPSLPVSPYPPNTLRVGYAGAQEIARSYVAPNLAALPLTAAGLSGTMTLPVATDTAAGTARADTAHIAACLATAPIPDGTEGAVTRPPGSDCSVSEPLVWDATSHAFHVDLTPFLTEWSSGTDADGLVLLPDLARVQQTDVWQVAFNGRSRAGFAPITSTIRYPLASSTAPQPAVRPPTPVAVPPVVPLPHPGVLPAPQQVAQPPAPPQVAPQQTSPSAGVRPVAYAHHVTTSMAFIAPLLLLAAGVFLARLFTRDVTPARPR